MTGKPAWNDRSCAERARKAKLLDRLRLAVDKLSTHDLIGRVHSRSDDGRCGLGRRVCRRQVADLVVSKSFKSKPHEYLSKPDFANGGRDHFGVRLRAWLTRRLDPVTDLFALGPHSTRSAGPDRAIAILKEVPHATLGQSVRRRELFDLIFGQLRPERTAR